MIIIFHLWWEKYFFSPLIFCMFLFLLLVNILANWIPWRTSRKSKVWERTLNKFKNSYQNILPQSQWNWIHIFFWVNLLNFSFYYYYLNDNIILLLLLFMNLCVLLVIVKSTRNIYCFYFSFTNPNAWKVQVWT